MIVFVSTYALLIPAITLEKNASCGIEEHQHDQGCYEQRLVCGLNETEGHEHSEDCYSTISRLDCSIQEHQHTENCYDADQNLTCALEEHSHDSGCWTEDRILSCEEEETEPHHHTDACYEEVLICENQVHIHSAACFVEEEPEEPQADPVLPEPSEPQEDQDQQELPVETDRKDPGVQTDPADGEAPVNSEDSADGTGAEEDAAAGSAESIPPQTDHDDAGGSAGDGKNTDPADTIDSSDQGGKTGESGEQEAGDKEETVIFQGTAATLTWKGPDYKVTAAFTGDAGIPEGAELEVVEITDGDSIHGRSYEEYVSETESALGMEEGSAEYIRLFDISIVKEGEKLQPAAGETVDVRIELMDADKTDMSVVHFEEDGGSVEVVDNTTETTRAGAAVSFEAEGFSVYGVVSQESATGSTALDGQTYVLVSANNALLMGEPHATYEGRLAAKSANPSVGGTINISGTATMWSFEAVPDLPGWYYISDGNGNYLNITSTAGNEGTVTLGDRQAVYVDTRQAGDVIQYQLRNSDVQAGSKAVNNYGNNVNNGFAAWVSGGGNNEWFRLYEMEFLGDIQVSFNANGGTGTVPPSMWGLAGDHITLPDYTGTRSGYTFLGWSTSNNLNQNNFQPLYPPGSSYTVPDRNTTLYAVWNNNTPAAAKFYIRLDGTIPNEPGNFAASAYSSGITITGAAREYRWIIDSDATKPNNGLYVENAVAGALNQLPDADQLVQMINGSAGTTGFRVENQDGNVVVTQITNPTLNDRYNKVSPGDELYFLWYVQKVQGDGIHVDGGILIKNRVNLTYDGNTPDGTSRNVPLGYQVTPGTEVTVGADGSRDGPVKTPTRAGYSFLGWNTARDGSGTWYSNNSTMTINEDTTLFAQWSKGTNIMMVRKTNEDGEVLEGARFRLEEKTAAGSYIEKANRTTGENGTFTYDQLENDTLYRMTETYAPNGYEIQNAFFFKVATDDSSSTILGLHLCDENGNYIPESGKPDWLDYSYIPAGDPAAQGVARIQFNIEDEYTRRDITLVKVDENGAPLSGAKYTLTGRNGAVSGVLKAESDSSGVFSSDDAALPYGSYTLTESTPPVTYGKHEDVEFTLNDYVDSEQHGLSITSDPSGCVVEASCDVTTATEQGAVITTYSYTIRVKDEPQAHIVVTKDVEVDGDLRREDLNTTVYFALTKKGAEGYVTRENGEIWVERMDIVNGVADPDRVVFDGVDFGEYDVWEMALIGGEYTRMYNGLVMSESDGFQLDTVAASSEDGGNNANVSAEDLHAQVDFTNHYGEVTLSTTFAANKRWTDRSGVTQVDPPEGAEIEFTLYSEKKDAEGRIIEGTQEEVRSITLDGVHDPDGEITPWTATFKYLPVYDENGLEYSYKVRETVLAEDFYPNNYPAEYYVTTSGGTITNRRLRTDIEIHKQIEADPADPAAVRAAAENLQFTLTGPGGLSQTFALSDFDNIETGTDDFTLTLHNMPLGTYTLTESGQEELLSEAGYELVYAVDTMTADTGFGGTEHPVFDQLKLRNIYAKKGQLKVEKSSVTVEQVDETPTPDEITEKAYQFVVRRGDLYLQSDGTLGTEPYDFSLHEHDSRVFSDVPTGTYTVLEKNASVEDYDWEVTGAVQYGEDYGKDEVVEEGEMTEASFDNKYTRIEIGSLLIDKTVVGGPLEAMTKDYRVTVTTQKDDETFYVCADGSLSAEPTELTVVPETPLVIENVHAGNYTITENTQDAAFADYGLEVRYFCHDRQSQQADVHHNTVTEASVTNTYTYLYTPVKITKTVTGNMGDPDLFFGFDVYVTDADDVPIVVEGVTNEQGLLRFNLQHGQSSLIGKLPKGAKLKIVEHNVHYHTTVNGRVGVGDGETTVPLTAEDISDEESADTTETYTFIIPEEGATVDFINDHTVEPLVELKKTGFDNRDGSVRDLAGAVFRIYTDEDRAPEHLVSLDGETEFTSGGDGIFYSGRLAAGTYYLDEITVPDGYMRPVGMFVLEIAENAVTLHSTVVTGTPDLNDWISEKTDPDTEETIFTVSIRNVTGCELPSTGGTGTGAFTMTGSILILSAAAMLFQRRRRFQR